MPLSDKVMESYETALARYGFDAPHLSIVKLIEAKSDTKLRS
jgi:3-hydroxyisobutyrate dehydrogenase